jgi:hypothetical protein
VQEDELAATPDVARREALLNVVPRERVPTSVAVWDVSRWGEAELGDGSDYEAVRGESRQRYRDAIIAATAESKAQVLVTEDQDLASRSRDRLRVTVWDADRLVAFASSDEGAPEAPGPLGSAGRVLQEAEWLDLEQRVAAHGQVLKDVVEALRLLSRELKRANVLPGGQRQVMR